MNGLFSLRQSFCRCSWRAASRSEWVDTMNSQAIEALKAIVEEVAGVGFPFSADSYLPAHLIHDARQAIEQYEREQEASQ